MNKIIPLISLALMLSLFACIPLPIGGGESYDRAGWYVKNSTGSNVFVKFNGATDFVNILVPGDSMTLFYQNFSYGNDYLKFDYLYLSQSGDDYVEIETEDKVVVKKWRESERNNAGRQLFDEQYWRLRKSKPVNNTYFEWTFDLLPEDLE